MAFNVGGLATGLDTNSLIGGLMEVERQPLYRLEAKKETYSNTLSTLSSFDSKLESLLTKIKEFDTADKLIAKQTSLSSEDFFSATASSEAVAGNYQVKVIQLAQTEKNVSADGLGYADKNEKSFKTGTMTLSVGGNDFAVNVTDDNNSLAGIVDAINTLNTGDNATGVAATIINDGDEYRLVLTGDSVDKSGISLDASGLTGGSGTYANPTLAAEPVQVAQQAKIEVDGILIQNDSNTISDAIPGVSLDLTDADNGASPISLTVKTDQEEIKKKVDAFVSAYNEVVSFITDNTDKDGDLRGDASVRKVKSRLQGMLTTTVENSGVFKTLSEIGLETQQDGTLSVDSTRLTQALEKNLDSIQKVFLGDDGSGGGVSLFRKELEGLTDNYDGLYAVRKESTDNRIKSIDRSIEQMEARLELKEKAYISQFTALEDLVSKMNSSGAYLSQQMNIMSNMFQ